MKVLPGRPFRQWHSTMSTLADSHVFSNVALALLAIALGVSAGFLQTSMPLIGPGLLFAAIVAPIMLVISIEWQVIGILGLLVGSRLLDQLGAPTLINYASYGLVALVAIRIVFEQTWQKSTLSQVSMRLYWGLAILACVIVASALVTDWHALRPILMWLILASPFVVFAVVHDLPASSKQLVQAMLLGMLVLQIPFALIQFAQSGFGDHVQGTFVGQGAGAHIAGAVCLVGAVTITLRSPFLHRPLSIALAISLVAVGVLSDAKQLFGAAVVAIAVMVLPLMRAALAPAFFGVATTLVLGALAVRIFPVMGQLFNRDYLQRVTSRKINHINSIADHLDGNDLVVGVGPGNGMSRVAQLTLPDYGNVPEILVGSKIALLAARVTETDRQLVGNWGSSTSSPFSSIISVFVDLGIVGCAVFAYLAWQMWNAFAANTRLERAMARALLLVTFVLGLVSTWWEEPAFTVVLATALATLTSSTRQTEGVRYAIGHASAVQQNLLGRLDESSSRPQSVSGTRRGRFRV